MPVLLFPDESCAVVPLPSSNPYAATRPLVVFETVTVTAVEVVVFPAASRATAVSVWLALSPSSCPT